MFYYISITGRYTPGHSSDVMGLVVNLGLDY